jgi:hypothetical protein
MDNMDVQAERSLIASIINQAIVDGCSVKNPKSTIIRNQKYNIYKQKFNFIACFLNIINFVNAENFHIFPYFIVSVYNKLKIRRLDENEKIAWEARNFFNDDSYMYNFYCELLDINPIYLSKKINDYFKKIDNGVYKKPVLKINK